MAVITIVLFILIVIAIIWDIWRVDDGEECSKKTYYYGGGADIPVHIPDEDDQEED